MKFIFTADVHLSRYSNDKEDEENIPERLASLKKVLYFIADYCCKSSDIRTIVIGGDILHGKSVIYVVAQNLMLDYFDNYPELTFVVLDGNHDLSGKGEAAVSALRPLKSVKNVIWVTKEPIFTRDKNNTKNEIAYIPYTADIDSVVKKFTSKILISHFGLNEGIINSGMSIRTNITTNDLVKKYDLVLLGHYHKPQEIITDNIKIYYAGSLIQLDWSEKNDEKRVLVVDSETLEVQSVPTEGYKKHIELEITNQTKDEVIKLANQIKKNGDHVRILKKEFIDLKKIEKEFIIVDKTQTDITDRGITSSMSQKDKHLKYLEIKKIEPTLYEEYMKIGLEIVNQCEGDI
jgi:DNA repair exonuclease SbcCD nuclease subunit